jgi:chromosome segregation protein
MGLAVAVFAAVLCSACDQPPDKEMQQAQGAIEAARAAGADRYAHEEFAAAEAALKSSRDAVAQRDYRLALNNALDSRDRAQTAAKQAADNKAVARGDADRALVAAMAALNDAHTKLKAAENARPPSKALESSRQAIADADGAVQEARTQFNAGDYLAAMDAVQPIAARLQAAIEALAAPAPPPVRRRR